MFRFLSRSPETVLQRELRRLVKDGKIIRLDFDGTRAIASRRDTGHVLGSDELGPVLDLAEGTAARRRASEALLTKWLMEYARQEMDPVRLVPLVRRATRDDLPQTVWSEQLAGDLRLYAALDLPGALVPLTEADLAACNLFRDAIGVRLRANWAARQQPLRIQPREGGLFDVSLLDKPELATSLLNGRSLAGFLEGLGWRRARLVVPGRDRLVLVQADDPSGIERLEQELTHPDANPESSLIWDVDTAGRVTPIAKAA